MAGTLKLQALKLLRIAIAALPWLAAMYLFFWLDSSGTWTAETPHRGKLSVIILATGMVLTFYLYSYLSKPRQVHE